jgi:hypothetical protein
MSDNKMEQDKIQKLAEDLWLEFADESDGWQTTMNYESFIKAINQVFIIPDISKSVYPKCGCGGNMMPTDDRLVCDVCG